MRERLDSVALALMLCLGATSCHKEVLVGYPYTSYPGAKEGDILVFEPYLANQQSDYWVVFPKKGQPCALLYYKNNGKNPPQCKVVPQPSGTSQITYFFTYSNTKPPYPPDAAPAKVPKGPIKGVAQCKQCAMMVRAGSGKSLAAGPPTFTPPSNLGDQTLSITCDALGKAQVSAANPVYQGSEIDWVINGTPPGWSVTFPSTSTCNEVFGTPAATFGTPPNTNGIDCFIANTVTQPTPVTYTVQADQCTSQGTGQLVITPKP
jgi:hypothetical protein